jgi:glycosyltransferase involved in cell wall biosynthesis
VLLVLAGRHDWLAEPFFAALARHSYREDVWLVRDASDATVRGLLRGCRVFLNLSSYEGFGLPVLEALAEGACVLSTPAPSLEDGGFPADGTLESAEVPIVAARVARLLEDATARESLSRRASSAVGAFYRSRDASRLAELYGP